MQASNILLPTILCLALHAAAVAASAAEPVYRFDMGTADSPVAAGYRPVTAESAYSAEAGYGWIGNATRRESFHRTEISPDVVWRHAPSAEVVDGVASSDDLVFRIDIPNGRYRVEIQLGDLGGHIPAGMGRFLDTGVKGEPSGGPGGPLFSMAVDSGDRRVASDIAARTLPHRGTVAIPQLLKDLGMPDQPNFVRLGNHAVVKFDETVTDGRLELRFHGDESTYRSAVERLKEIDDERLRMQSMYLAGGPFSRNSVLAVIVRPALPAPFSWSEGKLALITENDERLAAFVRAFNAEDFEAAGSALDSLPQETFAERHARLLARMWLAGHPNRWDERELLPRVIEEVELALRDSKLSPAERAELESLQGMLLDMTRGIADFDQRTREGQEVITCMNRAEAYFARALPGEPLYWKSKLYQARIWYSMDPNRNAQLWRRSEEILRELAAVYPENRWVRYYLDRDPSGWPLVDYRAKTQGAPEWAVEVHNFYNRVLDLCEWWIDNRQQADNAAIGGEWGDDVEFMPLIACTAIVCPDASPRLVEGTMRFADGVWHHSGIVDVHNGFFHLTSDAEHAAEFTGNVLGMMQHVKPGDPEFVERSLKTGKLMRDVWMGRNARGQRLLRSSFLGAFHVPNAADEVDSAICGRALNPAWNVLELTGNSELTRLALEYADTLRELALSTQKGKPRGVLPGPVVFETGELGRPGTDEWWLAPHGPFQGMFSFPEYHGFRRQILTQAWRLTDDEKYLEPLRLEAELVERHYPRSQREEDRRAAAELAKADPRALTEHRLREAEYRRGPEAGTAKWTARLLGSEAVDFWEDLQTELHGSNPETTGILLDKEAVADEARELSEVARLRWPMMTDDATMTDRVAFHRSYNSSVWYSGTRIIAQQFLPSISYEGAGRDFAALVLRRNPRYAKLLYYGFQEQPRDVTLLFWELEPHGVYRLTGGLDADGDDHPDEITIDEQFELSQPSGGLTLHLPPGVTHVLEVRQVSAGRSQVQASDPAIAPRDIHFDPRGHLLVDVHNIGNLPGENIEVTFYDGDPDQGGERLGRTVVSYIEPPNALQPQIVRTGIEWSPTRDRHEITVVLDGQDQVRELFESNNRATSIIESRKTSRSESD